MVHGWRVNLDGDPHMEHVRLMLLLKPNPFGGTVPIREHWLQVVDRVGGRTVKARISPILEHMLPRWITIADLDKDGRPEIFYRGFNGGAGAVPVFAGIRGWDGTAKHRFWSYGPPFPALIHTVIITAPPETFFHSPSLVPVARKCYLHFKSVRIKSSHDSR